MSTSVFYNIQIEEARQKLIETLMKDAQPAAIARFDTGVVAVAANASSFPKIRAVHEKFLFVAAGEYQDMIDAFSMLVDFATRMEITFSKRDLTLEVMIDHPSSVVAQIAGVFHSLGLRPKVVEFILFSLADRPPQGVIIAPTGQRRYINSTGAVGCKHEGMPEVPMGTEADVLRVLKTFVQSRSPQSKRFEIGVLREVGERTEFDHRWEDV